MIQARLRPSCTVALLLALLPNSVLLAQDSIPPFVSILLGSLDSLSRDPSFRALAGTKTSMEVFRSVKADAIARISDRQLMDFVQVFVTTLNHADTTVCAAMHREGFEAAMPVLMREMSTADAAGWARWYVNMAWASVRDVPLQPTADSSEIVQWYVELRRGLAEPDRLRILASAKAGAADAEVCWFERRTYSELLVHAPAPSARVVRAVMLAGMR